MAKIKTLETITGMSGKVCMHSKVYFRTNKHNGQVSTGKMCNPSTKAPSSDQVTAMSRFAKVSAAIRARLAMSSSEEVVALKKSYASNTTAGSLFGYAFKKWNGEYDDNGDLISEGDD